MTFPRIYFSLLALILVLGSAMLLSPIIFLLFNPSEVLWKDGLGWLLLPSAVYGGICLIMGIRFFLHFDKKTSKMVSSLSLISLFLIVFSVFSNHLTVNGEMKIHFELLAVVVAVLIGSIVLHRFHVNLIVREFGGHNT